MFRLGLCGLVAMVLLAPAGARAGEAETVTYLFPAPPVLPALGPWIVARQRGYYADEGLAVDFETGKGGADVAKQVGVGNAVVGGGMGDTPIIVRGNGVPVKSVAVLGDLGLTQLVVPADSPIQGAADLKGKTVNVTAYQETTYYATLGMLAAVGLDKSDVHIEAVGPAGIWQLFLAGKADAMSGVPDWIADVEQRGEKVRVIPTYQYFHSMGQAILASDNTIATHPELVRKLVRATLRGMQAIIDDPAGTAKDFVTATPQRAGQAAYVQQVFELYIKYVYGHQKVLGAMDPQQLAALQKFYVQQGISRAAVPVDELYTNQFVQ